MEDILPLHDAVTEAYVVAIARGREVDTDDEDYGSGTERSRGCSLYTLLHLILTRIASHGCVPCPVLSTLAAA